MDAIDEYLTKEGHRQAETSVDDWKEPDWNITVSSIDRDPYEIVHTDTFLSGTEGAGSW